MYRVGFEIGRAPDKYVMRKRKPVQHTFGADLLQGSTPLSGPQCPPKFYCTLNDV